MARDPEPIRLAESRNGLVTPLYFDRQVIRAEDLTLDRDSHARELARLRRYLHGWGVVAGMIPSVDDDILTVAPGYGVSPLGDEIYLKDQIEIGDIANRVRQACGAGGGGCMKLDPERRAAPADSGAWLIARARSWEADRRPGRPQGCEHPASRLSAARLCGGVALDLVCALPETHHCRPAEADLIWPYIASFKTCDGEGPSHMLPPPPPVVEVDNYLVLGRITTDQGGARFEPRDRRPLLPTELLQRWLTATTQLNRFYVNVNAQAGGEHEVHRVDCRHGANEENRLYLGSHSGGVEAVRAAGAHFETVDGCMYCCPEAHTR